jgi:predicted Zn finger-like uncharacterized protein
MSLVTRCPVCATAFRVQRAQLGAHGGRVRCGKCGGIFDGVAGLVEEGAELLALEPSPQLGLFDPSKRPQAGAAAGGELAPLPAFMQPDAEPKPRTSRLWLALGIVAAAALAAQAAYRFRAELLTHLPQMRTPLEVLCRLAGCEVLPRRLFMMSIDGDELRADPAREGVIVLTATIRNGAAFPQQYPSLQLFLEDEAGKPVVGRVLSPDDYLDSGSRSRERIAQGIAPKADTMIRVHLMSKGTPATRYRLVLFYPS